MSFKYKWSKWTPMYTDMLIIEKYPESYYYETRHLKDFIFKYFKQLIMSMEWKNMNECSLKAEFTKWSPTNKNGKIRFRKKDKLIIINENWKNICELNLWKFLNLWKIQAKILFWYKDYFEREDLILD